ncbi:MAG: GNAT family N-acetyltransferase [Actinomycetota bacterium]|nr:GNAT family N-acetyltransferase [Actinomycetota bacterium]
MLQGDQVTLRPMTLGDVPALVQLFAVPEVAEWWPGENESRLRARLDDADEGVGLMIEVDGRLIGFIQYFEETDPDYRHASIDVTLHPDWCDRGLGTDAVRTLARHLFDDAGHHRITIDPTVANARAIASYRKVGFKDVGVMRRYERANDGTWRDSLLMDLLAEELASSPLPPSPPPS